ncbi:peptidyl-prolyl cis-trans isomerase [Bartonella tamiae]|uniref:Parvulin-like PPIase n=1 Tax=Bartonella tamiae Th239 TaxID=1094558 RepID=J1JZZ4_9HYPH|nr:peptidyl-prolyl cis-trans isomerase [Bartonella tamiae]EJF90712.1 hypothetical protein ME5_01113 [Bartonella tamiae Th239]EJF93911.1 hypothetical protein MEG_00769 [Bartonella tamiae Th307]
MLINLRKVLNSWIAKVLFGLFLLYFALLWGLPNLAGGSSNDLIVSGKSKISIDTYRLALNDQIMRLSVASNLGRPLTVSEAEQYGIPQMVLNKMQQDVLFNEQARLLNIGVSKDGIARAIGSDPFFHQNGRFDRNLFLGYLRQLQISEADIVHYYAAKEDRDQLIKSAIGALKAPDVYYSALLTYKGETRTADYLLLTPNQLDTIDNPTNEELQTWFEAHKDQFQAPEYRKVALIEMNIDNVLKPQDISTDEAKAYYEQNVAQFEEPERRTIEELVFKSQDDANKALTKLNEGTSFDDLIVSENKTKAEITKGPLSKDEFSSLIASEVFSLPKDGISGVVNDLKGPILIRVRSITPSAQIPFEQVEQKIRHTLAKNHATQSIKEMHEAIENERFEGVPLKELAQKYGLNMRELTLDSQGLTPDGTSISDIKNRDNVLQTIFQSSKDSDIDPLTDQNGGYIWLNVEEIIPQRTRSFDEIKQTLIENWKSEQTQKQLDQVSQQIAHSLQQGKSLDQLAQEFHLQKQTARGLQRGVAAEIFGQTGVNDVFSSDTNHSGVTTGTNHNARIIYQVTGAIEPLNTSAQSLNAQEKKMIDAMMGEDLRLEMLQVANEQHPIKVNTQNYSRILNNLQ